MKLFTRVLASAILVGMATICSCKKDVLNNPPIPRQVPHNLIGKEFVFNKAWDWVSGGRPYYMWLTINTLDSFSISDLIYLNMEVSMKLDTSVNWMPISEWNGIPPLPANGYYWFRSFSYLDIYKIYQEPFDTGLIGKPAQVKVKILWAPPA